MARLPFRHDGVHGRSVRLLQPEGVLAARVQVSRELPVFRIGHGQHGVIFRLVDRPAAVFHASFLGDVDGDGIAFFPCSVVPVKALAAPQFPLFAPSVAEVLQESSVALETCSRIGNAEGGDVVPLVAGLVFHPPPGVAFLFGFVRTPGAYEHGVPLPSLDPRHVPAPGLPGGSFPHVLLGIDMGIDVHIAHLAPFVNRSRPEGPHGGGAVGFQVRVIIDVGRHTRVKVAALGEHVQVPAGEVGGFRPVRVEQVHHDDVRSSLNFISIPARGGGKR